jgi:hypothetical protein
MLTIVISVLAMLVGVGAGVYIGIRRPNLQSDGAGESQPPSGLQRIRDLLARLPDWITRVSCSAKSAVGGLTSGSKSRGSQPVIVEESPQATDQIRKSTDAPVVNGESASSDVPEKSDISVNLGALNCRARIGREPKGDTWQTVLIVDICGAIEAPDDGHDVDLKATLSDITDHKGQRPLPVLPRPKHGPIDRSSQFSYQTGVGKLCNQHTVLTDWMTVAQISPEWFVLPRQGHRELRLNISIVSRATGQQLAAGTCTGAFENLEIGYLDIDDNIQRAKTLAVGLAFSVGAANNALQEPEINVIHGWVRTNFGSGNVSEGARLELEQALRKTAGFFLRGGRLNLEEICREIVEIAPMVGRLDIMDLSLRVAGAKGQVTATDIRLLKDLAQWLQIDRGRLRTMVEKALPVSMHQSEDAEMILGVTTEMSKDEVRHQLNREYAKWSSRVISSDPAIRNQADQMLNLIANARTQYIGVKFSQ